MESFGSIRFCFLAAGAAELLISRSSAVSLALVSNDQTVFWLSLVWGFKLVHCRGHGDTKPKPKPSSA